MDKDQFLDNYIFYGLENLNDGFDSITIKYFSEVDFKKVLERVEKMNVVIHGIEPWLDGSYFDVLSEEDFNKQDLNVNWYWFAFQKFIDTGEKLMYSASYDVQSHLLAENDTPNKL